MHRRPTKTSPNRKKGPSPIKKKGGTAMRGIVDKLILLFFGLVLLLTTTPTIKPILLLLGVFIALAADELASSFSFSGGLFFVGVIVSIVLPDLLFFLPVLCYPLCVKRPTPVLLASLLPVIRSFFTLCGSASFLQRAATQPNHCGFDSPAGRRQRRKAFPTVKSPNFNR